MTNGSCQGLAMVFDTNKSLLLEQSNVAEKNFFLNAI